MDWTSGFDFHLRFWANWKVRIKISTDSGGSDLSP